MIEIFAMESPRCLVPCYGGMNPEVIKLMADLERYRNLRSSIIDEKAKEDLDHLIKETEERLWELENATTDC